MAPLSVAAIVVLVRVAAWRAPIRGCASSHGPRWCSSASACSTPAGRYYYLTWLLTFLVVAAWVHGEGSTCCAGDSRNSPACASSRSLALARVSTGWRGDRMSWQRGGSARGYLGRDSAWPCGARRGAAFAGSFRGKVEKAVELGEQQRADVQLRVEVAVA